MPDNFTRRIIELRRLLADFEKTAVAIDTVLSKMSLEGQEIVLPVMFSRRWGRMNFYNIEKSKHGITGMFRVPAAFKFEFKAIKLIGEGGE
jgi:hypothetical protein